MRPQETVIPAAYKTLSGVARLCFQAKKDKGNENGATTFYSKAGKSTGLLVGASYFPSFWTMELFFREKYFSFFFFWYNVSRIFAFVERRCAVFDTYF